MAEKIKQFLAFHDSTDAAAQKLSSVNYLAGIKVLVKASLGNSGNVYVGHDSSVSSANGYELDAGEFIELPVEDTDKIWVIGSDAAQEYSVVVM